MLGRSDLFHFFTGAHFRNLRRNKCVWLKLKNEMVEVGKEKLVQASTGSVAKRNRPNVHTYTAKVAWNIREWLVQLREISGFVTRMCTCKDVALRIHRPPYVYIYFWIKRRGNFKIEIRARTRENVIISRRICGFSQGF